MAMGQKMLSGVRCGRHGDLQFTVYDLQFGLRFFGAHKMTIKWIPAFAGMTGKNVEFAGGEPSAVNKEL